MSEIERLSRGQDYLGNIARMLGDLQGVRTFIHELIQNADDAPGATRMRFSVTEDRLEVWNDGLFDRCDDLSTMECGWLLTEGHRCDFHSFRMVGSGDKLPSSFEAVKAMPRPGPVSDRRKTQVIVRAAIRCGACY